MGSSSRYDDDDRYERRPNPESRRHVDEKGGRRRRGRSSDSEERASPPRRRGRAEDRPDGSGHDNRRCVDRDGWQRDRRRGSSDSEESPSRRDGNSKRATDSRQNRESKKDNSRPLDRRRERASSSSESGELSPPRKSDRDSDRRRHDDDRDGSKPREDSPSRRYRDKERRLQGSIDRDKEMTQRERAQSSSESGEVSPRRRHNDNREDSNPRDDSPSRRERDKERRLRGSLERDKEMSQRQRARSSSESGEASPLLKSSGKDGDRKHHHNFRDHYGKPREDAPSRRDKERQRRRRASSFSDSAEEDSSPRRRGKGHQRWRGWARSSSGSEESPRKSRGKDDHKRHHDREDRSRRDDKEKTEGEAKATTTDSARMPETMEQLPPPPPPPDMGRSGGVYVPPFKLARMMREVQDKSSEPYQRMSWDALRKSINGLVNKVNATNIKNIIPELFAENLIRGRGLFCRSCMKSQMASPGFTDVFAALVAVVNTKFPDVGKLLLNRIVLQLKRAYKRNDKPQLLAATKFIAHLVNQQVAHEIVALELLTVLLEKPTDDSVEVAVGFVKECGSLLQDLSPQGLHGIFERFRGILHEGEIDKRVQFLIEGLFAIRKAKFEGFPAVRPELDLVDVEDQFTHEVSLEDEIDPETTLDIFRPNPQFLEDEKAYENLKRNILGAESSEDEDGSDDGDDEDDEDDEDESDEEEAENMRIKDETETNLVNLRRTIYLTIMSSVDFEEAGHKLLKIKLEPGQEMELCIMLLECCSQERTYLRYYGLLGQRFCLINKVHQENFEKCFVQQYSMIHRLETNKLRNVAKFFAHLLGTDALPWHVLAYIRLTEEDTTSSSRIFIKILFQELSEHLGIRLLNERLSDPTMQDSFESIFPKDNPKNTRFAINFFTSIGLGGITENLREYLKNMPRLIMQQQKAASSDDESGSSGSSSSESESASDSDSSSGSDSESESESESEKRRKRRRR